MTGKRFTIIDKEEPRKQSVAEKGIPCTARHCCTRLNRLTKENEYLKQQLYDYEKDKKQLGISFMEFKMQLIEVLQQNYNYAYNQRQRNLDNSIISRTYEVLYQTIYNIAETMNVDIEISPKMIKFSVPCKCGGTLKRHSSYTGQIYWYCSKCNRRIEGDEFND